jgi:hypothetical protein
MTQDGGLLGRTGSAFGDTNGGEIPPAATGNESEAYRVLLSLAHRKTGAIPAPLLVRHVLTATRGADWPVQRAAMEALLRRCGFGKQDRLEVASAPRGRTPFGFYATRRAGSASRPYTTWLGAVDPLRGSCDCPDYLRNSLGACKHLLAVIERLAAHDKQLNAATAANSLRHNQTMRLHWDPIRPLTGDGDWLERIRLLSDVGSNGNGTPPRDVIRRWFRRDGDAAFVLANTYRADPVRRLELVNALAAIAGNGSRRAAATNAEPAVHALLRIEQQNLRRATDALAGLPEVKRALRSLKRQLYPYQVEGVSRLLASGRLLLADDMGLGKTAQATAACHALWTAGRVQRGLLIVPASLKPQWLREWQLFTDAPAAIVEGGPDQRRAAYRSQRRGFLIANYEQVLRDLEAMHAWRPDVVVLDEAQRIKNWATKTAAYVKKLQPPYRLVLTGTPMENRLEELASLLDWVDDLALEPKWRLVPWHSVAVDSRKEIGGARNLDTLRRRLSHCVVRRVRQEVLAQLPPRTDTVVPVEITEAQADRHDDLNQPIAQLAAIGRQRPLTQSQFLRLMSLLTTQRIIANGLAQLQFAELWPQLAAVGRPEAALLATLSSPKLLELREIVSQLVVQQSRKVVIFSQWRRMLTLAHWAVSDVLADAGVRAVFFTGHEGTRRRTQNLVDLHDDPATRVLFATDAGGVGLNLQRAASACINVELPWNPAVLEQRIGRIYRLGQKRPIDVYNLVTQDSIEARIAGLVADKRALFAGLFDGSSDEIHFERSGSFLSRLEKLVEPIAVPELSDPAVDAPEAALPLEHELDEMVSAADESQDTLIEPVPEPAAATPAPAPPETAVALPSAVEVKRLFASLQIRPGTSGGIVIEAPPDAAAGLAALFEGMAQMLRTPAA